jgi:bacterioferritin-associated ferredoxin
MYVCICNAVSDRQIRVAVERGATTLKDLNRALGVAGKCGKCAVFAQRTLKAALQESDAQGFSDAMPLAQGA